MADNFTEEQRQAVNEDNKNIIVSAGAGSGKTKVLTARVIRKLKDGVNINNLLILTFTNKAAAEMKDRIRKAITEEKELIKELDYLDSSYITTFDSFSLSMVRKYSYLLNVSNNLSIADPSTIYLEKNRIIDDIFDRLYQERNPKFTKLIGDLTIKDDRTIKEQILVINDKLDLKYDKIDYLNNYVDNYYSQSNLDSLFNSYVEFLISKRDNIDKLLTKLSYHVDTDFFNTMLDLLRGLINSEDYDSLKKNAIIDFPNAPRGTSEEGKEIKKLINDDRKAIETLTSIGTKEELIDLLRSTKDYAEAIIMIIKELDERINAFKNKLNVYEFGDISKMAIKLVDENEIVRKELTESFNEIMIDEYQDTSDLQELFISKIENNNVYMVGDIKQSIYRFRNANPYIFKNKYDKYSKNDNGIKIDLTKNFRSRDEVIKNVNLIFSNIMTDSLGGADYVTSHQMIADNKDYKTIAKVDYNSNFELYNYPYDKDCPYRKEEIEIFFIAQDIKKKVEEKYQIYDKDKKILRDVKYSDFAILLATSKHFDLYKKIFQYFGIPMNKSSRLNLNEEVEISLFANIIKLIICRRDNVLDEEFKYALVSILRSYLFSYTDQEIFDIITNKNYDIELIHKIDSIVENIDSLSLNEIINIIIDKFNIYSKTILVGDIRNKINMITSIVDIFNNLSSIGYTIDDSYNYLSKLIEDGYKIEVKDSDVIPNSVKILTIHASKGLEYPICYFASLHNRFNTQDLNEKLLFYDKYGIITPYYKEGVGKTFVKDIVRNDYLSEEISERIRLFYVALTRTREKFIVVTSIPEKTTYNLKDSLSFLDFINYSKDILTPYIKELDIDSLNITRDYNLIKKTNYDKNIKKTDNRLDIKSINIDNVLLHKEKISKETHGLLDKDTKEKMKFGTMMHEILELLDFNNPDIDSLNLDKYYKDKIKNFLSLVDIDKVINTYKEYEFLYQKDESILHGIVDLILEYPDKISIIDYKLKNVDDENYIKQLESYKDYISLKTNKKIDIYLFSIIDGTLNKLS